MRWHRTASVARLAAAGVIALASSAAAGELSGSRASMTRQHTAAVELHYDFVKTPAQVNTLVAGGNLERVTASADLALSDVSFPYARPVVRLFIERLAAQYRESTGTRLVVTSLTRPTALQPRNASPLSVHPAGMAVDLRVPAEGSARAWLEKTLLSLEDARVLDVTREHTPPHFHVAVFPEAYLAYAARDSAARATATRATPAEAPADTVGSFRSAASLANSDIVQSGRAAVVVAIAIVGVSLMAAIARVSAARAR